MKKTLGQAMAWFLATAVSSAITFGGMWFLTREDGLVCILVSTIVTMTVSLLVDGYIDVLNRIRHEVKGEKDEDH